MNYTQTQIELLYNQYQQIEEVREKYDNKLGIYSISINNNIVYIGKSTNILKRLTHHLFYTNNLQFTKSNKYKILNQCIKNGIDIKFDLVCLCQDEDELGYVEGEVIRRLMPVLNYQIPKEEDYHKYTINKIARDITYKEFAELVGIWQPQSNQSGNL